jgi:glutamate 5-kinase
MLVDQLDLAKNEYLIVTSGAIAAGMTELEIKRRPRSIPAMQACAAVGQCTLMQTYQGLFFGKKHVAQLLLTSDDFLLPLRYRNLRNTLAELLRLGVLPIINENDSVSVRELVGAFGDNDELSALVAVSVEADWLILLTNVDGFLGHNGTGNHKLVRAVRYVTQAMEAECNGQSHLGRGGMRSKLRAARLAAAAGIQVAIANGSHPDVLRSAVERRTGTYFFPQRGTHNPWPPRLLSQVEPATN